MTSPSTRVETPSSPHHRDPEVELWLGDAMQPLPLPDGSAQCCVTSPPYWGLRSYGVEGQLGLESTPEEYVANLVSVFRDVRRVLRPDGTLWLNLGDSYAGSWGSQGRQGKTGQLAGRGAVAQRQIAQSAKREFGTGSSRRLSGLKPKDLVGIPWMVAFALRTDGWYLRADVVWSKRNCVPESVRDRPTRSHEYVFLLSKARRYSYDADAVREPDSGRRAGNGFAGRQGGSERVGPLRGGVGTAAPWLPGKGRNLRTVWSLASQPFGGAHFATMPPALAERCVLASSRPGDLVVDPFSGAGTTGLVALRAGRRYAGRDCNEEYLRMTVERLRGVQRGLPFPTSSAGRSP